MYFIYFVIFVFWGERISLFIAKYSQPLPHKPPTTSSMKKLALIGVFLISACTSYGQSDTIEVRKKLGTVFMQHGKNLTPKQLLEIVDSNPEAYNEMKVAKTNMDVATVFGVVGGILIGYPVGYYLGGGDPPWAVAGVGAGLALISMPFSVAYTKHAKNAVRIYNDELRQTGCNRVDFKLGMTSTGVGVWVSF